MSERFHGCLSGPSYACSSLRLLLQFNREEKNNYRTRKNFIRNRKWGLVQHENVCWLYKQMSWMPVGCSLHAPEFANVSVKCGVSNTPGNSGNLLELFFLLEIFWKFSKSPGNFLAEFACLLLLWFTILVFQNVSVESSGFTFNCNCNC